MKSFYYLSIIGLTLGFGASAATETNRQALKKELTVMESVFQTAFLESGKTAPIRVRNISSTYLANQGVVFNLDTNAHKGGFIIDLENIMDAIPDVPVPPITMVSGEDDFSFKIAEEWEHFAEDTAAQIQDAFRQSADELRKLRYEERDASWGERELEREKRDLQFQIRNTNENNEELQEALNHIEKRLAEVKNKRQEVKAHAEKLETEQKQKRAQHKQAREKVYRQFIANFEAELGDTLCRFGSGLRALPEGENVTFVMSEARKKEKDRIYVFDQKQIIDCVKNEIDANQLLSNATIYEF